MWKTSTIDEICNVEYGTRVVRRKDSGTVYPVYGGGGETFFLDKTNRQDRVVISRFAMSEQCTRFVKGKFFLNDSGLTLSPKTNDLSQELLDKIIISLNSVIYQVGRGTAQRNLDMKKFRLLTVTYPTLLSEQQHIVAKLDATFAEIDKTINISKKKITYIENIYESFLTSVYEKCKSTPDYQEKFFGNIIETLTDYHANGSYQTLKKHVELKNGKDFAYMVRSTDFEKKFTNNKRYISKAAYEFLTKSKVFGGEIIMSKIGNAGKVYLMPKISYPCSLAMNLFLIRLDESQSSNEFIYNFLKSKSGKIQISQRIKGAATQTITKDNVRSIKVPIVKKELQKKIVSKIYAMRENITKIKKNYIKKLDLLFKLKETLIADLMHS